MRDPAFLFYYRDFRVSTEKMTNEERGAYIQLMCVQAENGHVTDEDMKKICSNICFETMTIKFNINLYETVKSKFKEHPDAPGTFINRRLAEEIEKRLKYTESRRKNRQKNIKITHEKTYDKHMIHHMENGNENENINENIKGGVGEKNKNDIPQIYSAIDLLETDPVFLEQLAMKQHIAQSELHHMLVQFDLSKQEKSEYFQQSDLKKLQAGFTKWVNSWMYTERKGSTKVNGVKPEPIQITREMYYKTAK